MAFSILLVDYCSIRDTLAYIDLCNEKMKSSSYLQYFITDNSAKAEAWKYLEDNYKRKSVAQIDNYSVYEYLYNGHSIFCIPTYENLGYAKGNNVAGATSLHLFPDNHLLVSNNDILFEEDCDLDKVEKLFDDNDYWVIGPDVIQFGIQLNPVNIYSKWYYMFLLYLNTILPKKIPLKKNLERFTFSGCFWFIGNRAFKEMNGFDEGTFMYFEEQIMEYRVHELGGEMYYYPQLRVIHNHNSKRQTTKKAINYMSIIHKSGNYYVKKYLRPSIVELALSNVFYYLIMPIFIVERVVRDLLALIRGQ